MKTVITLCLFSLLATSPALQAQSKADEEAARNLPKAFGAAWARHDGHELAKIMDDNVDFVNVGAVYLRGKSDFEKYHTRLLSGRFKDANLTPLETTVRFLNPTTFQSPDFFSAIIVINPNLGGRFLPSKSLSPSTFQLQ